MGLAQVSLQVGKECYLRHGERLFVVEVLGMAKDTVWLSFPDADAPRRGSAVRIEVHDGDGFASYHARMCVGPKQTGNGVLIERRASTAYMKHRRSWRVPVDLPTWITSLGDEERHSGHILDLCDDGAKLTTKAQFDVGEEVRIVLQLPRAPGHRVDAIVIYSADKKRDGTSSYGLRFNEISGRGRHSLTRFLSKRIQEIYPNDIRAMYPRSSARVEKFPKLKGKRRK